MVARAAGRMMMRISCCLSWEERLLPLPALVEGQLAGVLGGMDCEGGIELVVEEGVLVSVGSVPEGRPWIWRAEQLKQKIKIQIL
jgi:hypothetical protein